MDADFQDFKYNYRLRVKGDDSNLKPATRNP